MNEYCEHWHQLRFCLKCCPPHLRSHPARRS